MGLYVCAELSHTKEVALSVGIDDDICLTRFLNFCILSSNQPQTDV